MGFFFFAKEPETALFLLIMHRPNLYLAFEIALSIRFGFFVVPEVCMWIISTLWLCMPRLLFVAVYPIYVNMPLLVLAQCVFDDSCDDCAQDYLDNTKAYWSFAATTNTIERIQHALDSMLNSTLYFINHPQ